MKSVLTFAAVCAMSLTPFSATADTAQPELQVLASQTDGATGWLWTSSFQRADGETCAWIEVVDGQVMALLYATGSCRSIPSSDADRFAFVSANDTMLQFGGPDVTIDRNTTSMMAGPFNHVSRDSRFDLDNVVWRWLPGTVEQT